MQNIQQTLLSRFEGALVGMSAAQQAQMGKPGSIENLRNTFRNYVLLTGASIESIMHCRAVDLADWQQATHRLMSDDQVMVAILPIALYLHDDLPRLQATIQEIGSMHKLDAESIASMLFLATSITVLLTESCSPSDFIPCILATTLPPESLVYRQMQLIHDQIMVNPLPTNITKLIGAITQAQQPYLMPIAMATYCFLCSPTNVRLATQRAAHIPQQPPLTLALTGILGGAAHGLNAIPPSWCISDGSVTEMLIHLSTKLLRVWSGVYSPEMRWPESTQAIAAPGVIQKR